MATIHLQSAKASSWALLYKAGSVSAAVYVVLVLVPMVLVFTAPVPPDSGGPLLAYIAARKVVYLVELVSFVGLAVPALVVFTAVATALMRVDMSLALLGGLLGVVSETIALELGSSPQSSTGVWSCSAPRTQPPRRRPSEAASPAPPTR